MSSDIDEASMIRQDERRWNDKFTRAEERLRKRFNNVLVLNLLKDFVFIWI